MSPKTEKIINNLAKQAEGLPQPIHVIAVCSGGKTVGKQMAKYFKSHKIKASYHEVWTNIVDGKASVWKSDFKKKDYTGTALIAEDVIWNGKSVNATKRMLREMKRQKPYVAVILDCNHKADFANFR